MVEMSGLGKAVGLGVVRMEGDAVDTLKCGRLLEIVAVVYMWEVIKGGEGGALGKFGVVVVVWVLGEVEELEMEIFLVV